MTLSRNRSFALFFALFFLVWTVRATLIYSAIDLSILEGVWRLVFSNLVKLILWVLPAVFYLLWHGQQNPLIVMRITTHPDRNGIIISALLSLLFFFAVYTAEIVINGRTLLPLLRATPLELLGSLAVVFISPISEELLFRGFVLSKLDENLTFWLANLLQSLLFALMHWPNWLWTNGFRPTIFATSASIVLLGCLLGWITRRTNSIWPAIAIHIVNNFLSAFLG